MKELFSITIDPTTQTNKPSGAEVGRIDKNLTSVSGLTITEIATLVSQPYSYSWSPGIFNGYRSNDTWLEQEILALDFDSGISVDEALKRFSEFDITPNIIYYTFGDSPERRKFRMLIFIDEIIKDKELKTYIQNGLLTLFPEADQTCKDLARLYFGGTIYEVLNKEPIQLSKILDCVAHISRVHDNNNPDSQKRLFLYNIYKDKRISPTPIIEINGPEIPPYLKKFNKNLFDFNLCSERVKIFKDFLDGIWLYYPQLLGLATNLQWINGGLKLMKETMTKYNDLGITHYTKNNFNIIPNVKKMKYLPEKLSNFSPYTEDHNYHNLITATKDIKGHIEILDKKEKISLEDGRILLKNKFQEVMKNNEVKIYLFKLPTGIGKTELLTDLNSNVTIALPTHDLIDEVSNRMKIEYVVTPRIPKFSDETINKRIDYYYSIGLYKKVFQNIKILRNDTEGKHTSISDVELATNYFKELDESSHSTKTTLTTHQRSFLTSFVHDTIIYDEDPFQSLIEIKKLKISDLYEIENPLNPKTDINVLINYLCKTPAGVIESTPTFDIDPNELCDDISRSHITSNIPKFFASSFFIRDKKNPEIVHYVTKNDFPANKKIIIMSASATVNFYEKIYGDKLEVIDISNIKQQGQVIQHTSKSCSRISLKNSGDKILKAVEGKPTITFKNQSHYFNGSGFDIHFGNCEGYDFLKGKDINVVGTPHFNNIVYLLYAKILGLDIHTSDNTMSYQKIDWNGFRFMFQCYDNLDLRNIQLSLIESELIQAVGRARTLITDARVDLYSNFPLDLSIEFVY